MTLANRVLVDTAALYALVSSTDELHARARETYVQLLEASAELWISSYVLVEFGAIVQRRLGFAALRAFYNSQVGVFQTIWTDSRLHTAAWNELERRQGRGLNFVDWTVLLSARGLGARIFAFDAGLRPEGIEVVPGDQL